MLVILIRDECVVAISHGRKSQGTRFSWMLECPQQSDGETFGEKFKRDVDEVLFSVSLRADKGRGGQAITRYGNDRNHIIPSGFTIVYFPTIGSKDQRVIRDAAEAPDESFGPDTSRHCCR